VYEVSLSQPRNIIIITIKGHPWSKVNLTPFSTSPLKRNKGLQWFIRCIDTQLIVRFILDEIKLVYKYPTQCKVGHS
jgi:hypothetical protein